jgi:hypothetical protein
VACIVVAPAFSCYRGAQHSLAMATNGVIEQGASLVDECIGRIFEAADNPWAFLMGVPHCKDDRGKQHKLTIRRGTLTLEDRCTLNHHMIQTIRMCRACRFRSISPMCRRSPRGTTSAWTGVVIRGA